MKRITSTFIFALIYSIVYSQALPTQKEQYDFLKWYVKYKPLKSLSRVTQNYADPDLKSIDSAALIHLQLTIADKQFLVNQLIILNDPKKKSLIDSLRLKDANWQTKPPEKGMVTTYIFIPIFSIDRKMVLIWRNAHCGPMCGEGGWEAYVKKGWHDWTKCKTHFFAHFIS